MGSRVDQRATLGGPHEVARPKIPVHAARAFCAAARNPIERAARGGLDHLLERRERHLRPLKFRLREVGDVAQPVGPELPEPFRTDRRDLERVAERAEPTSARAGGEPELGCPTRMEAGEPGPELSCSYRAPADR